MKELIKFQGSLLEKTAVIEYRITGDNGKGKVEQVLTLMQRGDKWGAYIELADIPLLYSPNKAAQALAYRLQVLVTEILRADFEKIDFNLSTDKEEEETTEGF